ncbi:cell adhesion protein [Bacillus paranthracis]|uniref:cell adhesion protein n=1 Tax=Bacillus paranthracis TaxID=2026186 RepID=UPI0022E54B0E|nr:cell adhesion protein [Bacillus paranthracis]
MANPFPGERTENTKLILELYKQESGKVYTDDFDSIKENWLMTPQSSFDIASRKGFLRMEHTTDKDVLLLIDKQQGDVAIQVIADYHPTAIGDKGGLIIYQNMDNKVEFLESYAQNSSQEHKEWMAVSKGDEWNFYSKTDSYFDYVDSDKLSASKLGVILKKGVSSDYKPLDIDKIIITRGNTLQVRQLFPGGKVVLKDELDTVIATNKIESFNTGTDIPLPSLEFLGTLQIFDETNSLVAEVKAIFHGGDVYNLGSSIKVLMGEQELNNTDTTHLGYMTGSDRIIKMRVQNDYLMAVTNVKISIQQYMDKIGFTWAEVSLDNIVYSKEVIVNNLAARSFKEFYVKIAKDKDHFGFEPIYFDIHLKHD